MEEVFKSFCSFGADKGATPLMDGMKLVKMCRDQKLLDKNLTSTDVDIIFSKVKPKNERKINFKQFEEALKMISDKKFPGVEDNLDKLKAKILEGGGPVAHGATKAVKSAAVDRLAESPRPPGSVTSPPSEQKEFKDGSGAKRRSPGSGKTPPSSHHPPQARPTKVANAKSDAASRRKSSAGEKSTKKADGEAKLLKGGKPPSLLSPQEKPDEEGNGNPEIPPLLLLPPPPLADGNEDQKSGDKKENDASGTVPGKPDENNDGKAHENRDGVAAAAPGGGEASLIDGKAE